MFEFGFYLILEAEREREKTGSRGFPAGRCRRQLWAVGSALAAGDRLAWKPGARRRMRLQARSRRPAWAGEGGCGDDRGRAELVSMRGREVSRAEPGSGHRRGRERAWGTESALDVVCGVRPESRSEALRSEPSTWLESRGGIMATGGPLGQGGVDPYVYWSLVSQASSSPVDLLLSTSPSGLLPHWNGEEWEGGRGRMSAGWPGGGAGLEAAGDESLASWEGPGSRAQGAEGKVDAAALPPTTTVSGAQSLGPTFEEEMGWGRLRQGLLPFQRRGPQGLLGHFADGTTEASCEGRRPCAAHHTRAPCAPAALPAPLTPTESPWHGPLRDRPQLPMCWPAQDLLGPSQSRAWAWGSSLGVGFGGSLGSRPAPCI
nr:uncharacterized protein LOC127492279 [Oryctolagus cuniculus]